MTDWVTLDDLARPIQVIEGYESFIWSERYSSSGDFQILTKSTFDNRTQLKPGTWVWRVGSTYVMIVNTVEDVTGQNGDRKITVTGKSLENLLMDRVGMPSLASLAVSPNWVLTGLPADVARDMFRQICFVGNISVQDSIPHYGEGTYLPSGSIPEPTPAITVTAAPDLLYNQIKSVCDAYNLGFRFVYVLNQGTHSGQIFFEIYTGSDRTTDQNVRTPVVFAPELENLSQPRWLTSNAGLKNVAYVYAQNGAAMVYGPLTDVTVSGQDRHILLINSSNPGPAGAALTTALQQEGIQALAQQKAIYAFDGQLPANYSYVYGRDYGLGDIIEERDADGNVSQMFVTEQIFASDNTGDRSYPTLVIYQTLTTGSWGEISPDISWSELVGPWSAQ
jgi:hypothetical protein